MLGNWKLLLFHKDKKEVEASLTLGLTLRGIQIFQVGFVSCMMIPDWLKFFHQQMVVWRERLLYLWLVNPHVLGSVFRTWGLWGSCCTTSPGPMWESWCLWWVSCVITPCFNTQPQETFSLCFGIFLNAYFSDDESHTPPGWWWWACWSGSWKSLRKTLFSSVLPSYLSRAIPL